MRRLIVLAAACLLVSAGACGGHKHPTAETQSASGPSSLINVADPRAAVQLTQGFYEPEQGSWRWTARQFAAVLRAPSTAKEKGALLVFKFTIPEASIRQLKPLTLSAKVNGMGLEPETYTKSGDYTYQRDIPASLFSADVVTVDFLLDKALPPTGSDLRELGVVAQTVGLEAK